MQNYEINKISEALAHLENCNTASAETLEHITAAQDVLRQTIKDETDNQPSERAQTIADELAAFIGRGCYPMDVWQLVVDTLEDLSKKTDTGFNCPELVRAAVPVMLMRSNATDGLDAVLAAIRRHDEHLAKLTEQN